MQQVRDCIFLLANALGDPWKQVSKEAAAGMVLVVLAKNAELRQYLNGKGWRLVLNFVNSNPDLARNLSPRTLGEIFTYQAEMRPLPAVPRL